MNEWKKNKGKKKKKSIENKWTWCKLNTGIISELMLEAACYSDGG